MAAGNGEGGAGPVPVAGPSFGSRPTFKLPLAAGLVPGVATQVVGPSDAVFVGQLTCFYISYEYQH